MAAREDTPPEAARIIQFGHEVRGTFEIDTEAREIRIHVPLERHDPAVIARVFEAARQAEADASPDLGTAANAGSDTSGERSVSPAREYAIQITPRIAIDERRARLSGLRSAFLLGFAALGYRFAAHPKLTSVREQLARPDEDLLPPYWLTFTEVAPAALRLVALTAPVDALLVALGGAAYVLPLPWSPVDLYERLSDSLGSGLKPYGNGLWYVVMGWVDAKWATPAPTAQRSALYAQAKNRQLL